MGIYILKRLFHCVLVLAGITFLVFSLLFLSGNPVKLMMPPDSSNEEIQAAMEELGFSDPFHIQYFRFLSRVARLDFGNSLRRQVPVMDLIKERFVNTLLLASVAYALAISIAIPAGVLAALKRNSIWDFIISTFVLIGQATPVYWLGLVLLLIFVVGLGWFPAGGFGYTKHLVLPVISVAVFCTARTARMSRSAMLEVLRQDYIRTAKSQGIREVLVNFKFAFRNAVIPIITLAGMEFCVILEGSVVTEMIYSWPGVGRLIIQAVYDRDYPVVQGVVLLVATIILFVNLGLDILYTYLDPRIRYVKTAN